MNIEQRFLQKALEDKNYISFSHERTIYKKVKPLKIEARILYSDSGKFELDKISNIKISKEQF